MGFEPIQVPAGGSALIAVPIQAVCNFISDHGKRVDAVSPLEARGKTELALGTASLGQRKLEIPGREQSCEASSTVPISHALSR